MKALAERGSALEVRLAEVCHGAFQSLNFPLATILDIRVRELWSDRFSVEGKQLCYVVTVVTSNPPMLRGDLLPYKGSYKERAEAIVQDYLTRIDRGATAHLEIVGPPGASIDGLISLKELVRSGKATADSPLVRTAEKYGIPGALLHGRHLIGPSPALASLVRRVVASNRVSTVLDLFAGTGIAAKVACMESTPASVTVLEIDPAKIEFLRSHLQCESVGLRQENVFSYAINRRYDLIVADPFYEQVMDLLDVHGESIRKCAGQFLLACGSVEDIGWTRDVRVRLVRLGLKVRRHARFGQVVFQCSVD